MESSSKSTSPPPAILRGGQLMRLVAAASGAPVRATVLARELGIPRSSTVNIAAALCAIGFLRSEERGYTLGAALGELGQAYLESFSPTRLFAQYCQGLREPLPMTVQLATLDGFDVVYLARHDGHQVLTIASRVGGRLPVNCTALGKAMLAALPNADRSRLLAAQGSPLPRLTARSLSDVAAFEQELQITASRGYAVDDEETTPGIVCVAVALNMEHSRDSFAVSGSLLKSAATPERVRGAVAHLTAIAHASAGRPPVE